MSSSWRRKDSGEPGNPGKFGRKWLQESDTGLVRDPGNPAEWSRRAIIDVVGTVLAPHRDALTLVGAHAVMLRTAHLPVQPSATGDGDLGVTPSLVSADHPLLSLMTTAGFERRIESRPGLWGRGRDLDSSGRVYWREQIDLIVGQEMAGNTKTNSRSVRALGPDRMSAGSTAGIELSAFDRSEMEIGDLVDPTRRATVNVAGSAALICSKAYKLGERIEAGGERLRDKDAGDLWRLLECADPDDVEATFTRFSAHDAIGESVRAGALHADRVLRSSAVREMAERSFGGEVSRQWVATTFDRWASRFRRVP